MIIFDKKYKNSTGDTAYTYCDKLTLNTFNDWRLPTIEELKKVIGRSIESQYKNFRSIDQIERSRKAILIDCYDAIGARSKGLDSIFQCLDEQFGTIVITCDEALNSALSTTGNKIPYIDQFRKYELQDFDCNLRLQLIKKWYSHNSCRSIQELDSVVHKTENVITTVLGKNLVPSRPLYLLTLLQSTVSMANDDLHNSGMTYYYQYLISKSLDELGVGKGLFDELFSYLSNLAWFYRGNDSESIDDMEFREFNTQFSNKYTSVNFEKQLRILLKSKILTSDGGFYRFTYPYIKYFFLGKYFADHIDDVEIVSIISDLCANLGDRESAHLILFLTHHKNSEWVIDSISQNLSTCFIDHEPIKFDDDTSYFNDLIGSVSEIVISDLNVEESQKEQRQLKGEMEKKSDQAELDAKASQDNEMVLDTYRLLRSSEVLGQILKNYYGSITRDKKAHYLEETISAPLRLLTFFLHKTVRDPNDLAKKLEVTLKNKNKDLSENECKEISAAFISEFLRAVCTGIVAKISENIAAEKLRDDLSKLVENEGSNSYKLVQAATYLTTPGKLPMERLRKIAKDVEGNTLAFKILQTLAVFHIKMFHTPYKEKQQLGSLLKVNFGESKLLN